MYEAHLLKPCHGPSAEWKAHTGQILSRLSNHFLNLLWIWQSVMGGSYVSILCGWVKHSHTACTDVFVFRVREVWWEWKDKQDVQVLEGNLGFLDPQEKEGCLARRWETPMMNISLVISSCFWEKSMLFFLSFCRFYSLTFVTSGWARPSRRQRSPRYKRHGGCCRGPGQKRGPWT